jgi:hypothetical protein
MEESKLKLQNINQVTSPPSSSVSTNTIHQSFPSLLSPSLELPILKVDDTNSLMEDDRRSTKVESDVFKIVEQSRRMVQVHMEQIHHQLNKYHHHQQQLLNECHGIMKNLIHH